LDECYEKGHAVANGVYLLNRIGLIPDAGIEFWEPP
jgi:hypothetical protein